MIQLAARRHLPGVLILLVCVLAGACREQADATDHPSIDDLPDCDPHLPSFECLQRLFLPLRDHAWPFDRELVAAAYEPGAFYVLDDWEVTALHVIEGKRGGSSNCYTEQFRFADPGTAILQPDCGTFLFMGGHPHALECKSEGHPLGACVDEVPTAEIFDIGLVAAARGIAKIDVRDDVQVGEEVFLVGNPLFLLFLNQAQLQWFEPRYPLVSSGVVLALDGRGMTISNLAFQGNSGGPVLDRQGRAVGVAYTKIGDVRAVGVAVTDPALADHRTVAVRIDAEMKARIDAELAKTTDR